MNAQTTHHQNPNNGSAVASMVIGIVAWLLFFILLCLNYAILPALTIATMGVGGIFYVCTALIGCLSPIGWVVGTILGYKSKQEIKQKNQSGEGMATAGLILNATGLGLLVLGLCAFVIFVVFMGGLATLEQFRYQY